MATRPGQLTQFDDNVLLRCVFQLKLSTYTPRRFLRGRPPYRQSNYRNVVRGGGEVHHDWTVLIPVVVRDAMQANKIGRALKPLLIGVVGGGTF